MTTQNLDLNKMGLAPMTETEMQQVDGGSLVGIVRDIFSVVTDIATGFVKGFVEGFNAV